MRRGLIFIVILLSFLFSITVPSRASNQAPVGSLTTDPEVANEDYRSIVETWVGFPIAFNASNSSDADGTIVKYEWDWEDDGTYDYAETPGDGIATHTYPQAGVYRVRLKVTDDDDATDDAEYCDVYVWDPEDSTIRFYVNADCGHDWYNGKSMIPDGGNGPLATVQAAIDKVGDGSEENQDVPTMGYIIIAQGTYVENIRIDGKNIILTSLNPNDSDTVEDTILNGNNSGSTIEYDGTEDERCELRGLKITGGSGTSWQGYVAGGGIWGHHATPTISRCIFTGNNVSQADNSGYGGAMCACSGIIERCVITNNTADHAGGLRACFYGKIINCVIANNIADSEKGSGLDLCWFNEIINCTIVNNTGYGLYDCHVDTTITNCIIWGNSDGQLYNCAHPTFSCIEDYTPDPYCDMVSYWKLDEINTGTPETTPDGTGNGHTGNLSGSPTLAMGQIGNAIEFDSTNYIGVADHNDFDSGDSLTVAHWFKTNTNQSGRGMITHDGSSYKYLTYLTTNSGSLTFYIRQPSGICGAGTGNKGIGYWADDQWYFVVGTFDKHLASDRVKLYVDGALVSSHDAYNQDIMAGDEGIYIGQWDFDPWNRFEGILDEVAICNRALSPGEIQELYQRGLSGHDYVLDFNIADDPQLENPGAGDYHLQTTSPCINAGDGTYDYSLEPYGGDGRINMGAYGNTDEAALWDMDEDEMPDVWEVFHWPEEDPTAHEPGDDPDEDGLANLVEYRIGRDPTVDDTDAIAGYVTDSQTGYSYPTIQDALDWANDTAANPIDFVLSPGRFCESLNLTNRNISLIGSDPTNPAVVQATILDGNGQDVLTFIGSSADSCVVSGVTMTGGARGIYCESASPTIRYCVIRNNQQGGLYCYNNSHPEVENCFFYRNKSSDDGGAVYNDHSNPTLTNCVLVENQADNGGGIYNTYSSPILRQCTIFRNTAKTGKGGGVYNHISSSPQFINCILWENRATHSGEEVYNYQITVVPQFDYCCVEGRINGRKCSGTLSDDLLTNTCEDPQFVDRYHITGPDKLLGTSDDGLHLQPGSFCVDAAKLAASPTSDITGRNRIDIPNSINQVSDVDKGAYESELVWYVKSDAHGNGTGISWVDAFTDIQQALAQMEGTEIWVAAGTYHAGPAQADTFALKNAAQEPVRLYGGFRGGEGAAYQRDGKKNMTILDGAEINYHVVTGVNGAEIDGFVIQGGRADSEGQDGCGGGMINDGVEITISNCRFRNNYAAQGGGMWNQNSAASVSNCTFSSNEASVAGGGIYNSGDAPTILSCIFAGNLSSGAGGGIYNAGSSGLHARCVFYHNEAEYGGGVFNSSSAPAIESCVFYGNEASSDGGGITHENQSSSDIVNCTFFRNEANRGGALCNDASSPTVTNCILWGDDSLEATLSDEIFNQNDAMPVFSFCAIQNSGGSEVGKWDTQIGLDGGYNIDRDPMFEDALNPIGADGKWGTRDDGLHLRCYNPDSTRTLDRVFRTCLDAANGEMAPTVDLAGKIRNDIGYIVNFGVGEVNYADVGAYESPTVWYVKADAEGKGTGTCWEDALWDLQDGLEVAGNFNYVLDPNELDPNSFYSEEIWVAADSYKPCYVNQGIFGESAKTVSFVMKTGVDLYGGFAGNEHTLNQRNWNAHETILSGDLCDDGLSFNSYHVIRAANNVTLDGFTITGGYTKYNQEGGGGIYQEGGELLVRNCRFRENTGNSLGGGICCLAGVLTVENCAFSNNVGNVDGGGGIFCGGSLILYDSEFTENVASGIGGAIYFKGSLLKAENCSWIGNTSDSIGGGGAIYNCGHRMRIHRCVFQQNSVVDMQYNFRGYAGAVRNVNTYDTVISNCLFAQNSVVLTGGLDKAGYGGAISNQDSRTAITNCVFWENEAYKGGAVHNEENSLVTVANCIFHQNEATDTGGAIYNDTVSPYIVNSILWQDQAGSGGDEIYNSNGAVPNVTHCDISGGGGIDCINVDPQFKSAGSIFGSDGLWGTYDDGFRLQSGSACIDAAANSILRDPNVSAYLMRDLQEVSRQQNGGGGFVIDIGAYEFGGILTQDQMDLTTAEDTSYTFTPIADHIGSKPLIFSVEVEPEHGTVTINPDGTLTYEPDLHYYGTDSFRYRVTDGINSESVGIELEVTPVNDPPCAVEDVIDVKQNDEGVTSITCNVLVNDNAAHPDGDGATMDAFIEEVIGQYTITGDAAGNVTFDWDETYTNLPGDGDLFTYRITDPQLEEAFGTITIRLHTPPEAVADNGVILQGQLCSISVFDNDQDTDGDTLQVGDWVYPDPAQGTEVHGSVVYHGNGIFTYQPHWDFVGMDYFIYQLRDSVGNVSDSVAVAIQVYTPETLPAEFEVEVLDADGDGAPDSDELDLYGTSMNSVDSDGDGLWDGWEIHWHLDAESVVDPTGWNDPYVDSDGDDLNQQEESHYGTNPQQADTDGDGTNDGIEIVNGTNPLQPDDFYQSYYAHAVPYQTSFDYGDFIWYESVDAQKGWRLERGFAQVEGSPASQLFLDHDTLVTKLISDENFPDTTYVKATLSLPWVKENEALMGANAEIRIRAGDEIIAGVKFEDKNAQDQYLISIWDNQQGAYVGTNTSWEQMFEWWCELWFELDFANDRYKVHWYNREYNIFPTFSNIQACEPESICDYNDFDNLPETNYVSFDELLFETPKAPGTGGGEEEGGGLALNTVSVSGHFNEPVDSLITIESPCHCDGQISKARVPIIGSIGWDRLAGYELGICPGDLNPYDSRNWFWFDWGIGMVQNDVLGYWNTGRWPNGYYYLGIVIYDEIGYSASRFYAQQYGNTFGAYNTSAPLAPILLCNDKPFDTFVHVEKPEISIPWPGQFPFELKLIYNDKLVGWPSPIFTGWTHNHQISLVEDTRYYWASSENNFGIPYADDYLLAHGDVWITFGGGSRQLFRYQSAEDRYYPYRGDGVDQDGDVSLRRVSHGDIGMVTSVEYFLYQKDGTTLRFSTSGNFEIGPEYLSLGNTLLGWKLQAYIDSMSDRFGNTLTYTWNNRYEDNPTVMSIEYDPDGQGEKDPVGIYFEKPDYYYTKAEMRNGNRIYRTVNIERHRFQQGRYALKVWRSGRGVGDSGTLQAGSDFTRYARYYSHSGWGLAKINYMDNMYLGMPGNTYFYYDSWGQMRDRYDMLGQLDYLRTYNDYDSYHPRTKDYDPINGVPGQEPWMTGPPNPNHDYVSYLKKTTATYLSSTFGEEPYRQVTTYEDENGATIRQENTIEEDDICVSTSNLVYEHPHLSYVPTLIEEVIEQPDQAEDVKRYTTNVYNTGGELTDQYVSNDADYVQAEQCIHAQRTYHPIYGFSTSVSANDLSGEQSKRTENQYIYGRYVDGVPTPNYGVPTEDDIYLLQERVLLDGTTDTWAETTYHYDEQTGQLIEKIDPRGFRTEFEYDAYRNINRVRVGEAGSEQTVRIACYDEIGQQIWQADSYGKVERNYYDAIGHLYCVRTYADPMVLTLGTGVGGRDDPNRYDNIEGPDYTLLSTVRYGYDNWGNRTYYKNAAEGVIRTEYTMSNQPEKIHYDLDDDGQVDPDESYIEYQYDNAGRKDGEKRHYAADVLNPPRDAYTLYFYDPLNRLRDTLWLDYGELETANLLKIRSTDYDGAGRKVKEQIGGPEFPGGTLGCRETHYEYDIYDHLVQRELRTNEDGEPYACDTTQYLYNFAGNRTAIIDPMSNVTYTDYDNAGRITAKYFTAAEGTPKAQAVPQELLAYYPDNSLAAVTDYDTNGSTVLSHSTFDYDNRGRLTQVEQFLDDPEDPDPDKAVTAYEYQDPHESDKDQYRIKITDAENKPSYRYYQTLGNVAETIYPHPTDKTEKFLYNGNGSLDRKNVYDSNGLEQWLDYDYDQYGRLTTITYPGTDGQIEYAYDGFGRRIQIEDSRAASDNIGGAGTITFDYDSLGRLVNKTDQDGYQVGYFYRGDNQKLSIWIVQPGDPNPTEIYAADYAYYPSGRLKGIYEDGTDVNSRIAWFGYDDNGNRDWMDYHLDGAEGGDVLRLNYDYNRENRLTDLTATSYISGQQTQIFGQTNMIIDGLGRLTTGTETVRNCSQIDITHALTYNYDLLGRLDDATITNINASTWTGDYNYRKDGNLDTRTINSAPVENFAYTGDLITDVDGAPVSWDNNGNMVAGLTSNIEWNLDKRLRHAEVGVDSIDCRYAPGGEMIYKHVFQDGIATERKFIVDTVGRFPVILLEINSTNSQIVKTYFNAQGQTLMQRDGKQKDPGAGSRYFYVHDRLGSVRALVNTSGQIVNCYVYDPFGNALDVSGETQETIANRFRFAGYKWDAITGMYNCNARWYDPVLARFTGRDPITGDFEEPLTLHAYLYCLNDPINRIDPAGKYGEYKDYSDKETRKFIQDAIGYVDERGFPYGSFEAFGSGGEYDVKSKYFHDTFTLGGVKINSGDFGNYLTAYVNVYLYGRKGEFGTRYMGNKISMYQYGVPDDLASHYFITAGVLQATTDRKKEGSWGGLLDNLHYVSSKLNFNSMSISRLTEVPHTSKSFGNRIVEATQFWNTTSWY